MSNPDQNGETTVVKAPHPSRLRLALVMLVPVYPLITFILYIIMPLTDGWQIWQRTLLIAPLMIFSIIFVIGPNVQKYFGWFIARVPKD